MNLSLNAEAEIQIFNCQNVLSGGMKNAKLEMCRTQQVIYQNLTEKLVIFFQGWKNKTINFCTDQIHTQPQSHFI